MYIYSFCVAGMNMYWMNEERRSTSRFAKQTKCLAKHLVYAASIDQLGSVCTVRDGSKQQL